MSDKKQQQSSIQTKVQPRKLKGFQDYQPEVMKIRYHIMDIARKHGGQAGFQPIGTPALEYSEVLLGVGGETDKQVYRFLDNGKRDIALRFDLTVPFARYIGEKQGEMIFPFKRLQIGDVWRAEKPQKGRYREFCQCDLDIIGVNSTSADIEVLQSLIAIVDEVLPGGFTVSLGQRKVLSALLYSVLKIENVEQENQGLIILDKLAKIGKEKVVEQLIEKTSCTKPNAEKLLELLTNNSSNGDTHLQPIKDVLSGEEVLILDEFEKSILLLKELTQYSKAKILIDLSIARGLGYYTGIVFETTIDDLPGFGAICSGGRYDNLAERFTQRELPGVGGSVGLDRLTAALIELNQKPMIHSQEVYVAIADEKARDYAFKLSVQLRKSGVVAHCNLKEQKIAAQFKFANRSGFSHVITVGEQELDNQTCNLKNMSTGEEQKNISTEQAIAYLKVD